MQVLAQFYDGAVEVLDGFDGIHLAVANHELIVAKRLHLKVIVVIGDAQQLLIGLARHNGAVQLTRFAGGRKQQTLAILVQKTAGHAGLFEEILGVRRADNAVEVFEAHLVLHEDNQVVVFLFSTSLLPPRPVLMASTVWMSFSCKSVSMTSKMRASAMASSTAR